MKITTVTLALALVFALNTSTKAAIIVGGPATASPFSPTLGNGNFEKDSGSPLTFAAVSNWHDIEGDDTTVNFGHTQGFGGSPEQNSQGAFVFGQLAGNDTGHTVAAAGEVFDIDFYANKFGGQYQGDEAWQVVLFTSSTGVDANTAIGDIAVLSTTSFAVQDGWSNYTQDGIYTTVGGDVGQTVYLGFDFDNGSTGTSFPRIDVITWEVTAIPEPSSIVLSMVAIGLCIRTRIRG